MRAEPTRCPCCTGPHPGGGSLYLDHPGWHAAAESLSPRGKRFLTPSGKVEVFTPELDKRLAPAGHGALPTFYTHSEVTRRHPTVEYAAALVTNPVNPQAVPPRVRLGGLPSGAAHRDYRRRGMIGRPSAL